MTTARIGASLGEVLAQNIAQRMTALGWDYDRLADESGLSWGDLVHHRGDASGMALNEVEQVAAALGVDPAALMVEAAR